MATRAYKLRPEYKDAVVGGRFRTGPETEADLKELLDAGSGEIVTDDPGFQGVLENFFGTHGLMFEIEEVGEEGDRTPVELEAPVQVVAPATAATGATAASVPGAEHGEGGSEYDGLTYDELVSTARERRLAVSANATQEEVVQILENDDNRQEGAGSGS